jgi:hypothetical protein
MTNPAPEMDLFGKAIRGDKISGPHHKGSTEPGGPTTLDHIDFDDRISRFDYFLQQLDDAQRKAVNQMFNYGGFSNFDSLKARVNFLRNLLDDEGGESEVVAAGLRRLCDMLHEIMDVIRQFEQQEQQILDELEKMEETEQDSQESLEDETHDLEQDVEMKALSDGSLDELDARRFEDLVRRMENYRGSRGRTHGSDYEYFTSDGGESSKEEVPEEEASGGESSNDEASKEGSSDQGASVDAPVVEVPIEEEIIEEEPSEQQPFEGRIIDVESYKRRIDRLLEFEWDAVSASIKRATENMKREKSHRSTRVIDQTQAFEQDLAISAATKRLIDDLKARRAEQRAAAG